MTGTEPTLEPDPESAPEPTRSTPPWAGALAGAAAAGVALGIGELVAGFSHTFPSLVPSVGRLFVSETPGSVVRQTIQLFGTNQKPLLLTGITIATLVLGALFGLIGRRNRMAGVAGFVGFAVFGGLMAIDDPVASNSGAILVAAAAGVAGVAALVLLLGIERSTMPLSAESPTNSHHGRRAFLSASGAVAGFGAVTALGGRRLQSSNSVEAARADIDLPMADAAPAATATAAPAEADLAGGVDGLSSLITPNNEFYLIDTALVPPQVDPAGWSMTVKGMVDTEVTLTYDDLLARDLVEEIVTLSCVSNEVGGRLVGNAVWQGVPLRELLEEAGADPAASQIVGRSVDGWTGGFPSEILDDPNRVAMVAVGMNGEPLPVKHGFPARLVVEGLYGYVSATKWLSEVELTTWEAFDGYWVPRGWSKLGPIKTQSRIDVPGNGRKVTAGVTPIAGVAWAPSRGVARVEVQVDDGPWVEALTSESIGDGAWRQWLVDWNATPGRHRIRCRATDTTDTTQPEDRTAPAPNGATGWHTIEVNVEEA